MKEKIINKLLSGRYILTVVCAITFIYCVYAKRIPDTAIVAVLMMVFTAYFNKSKEKENA